MKALLLGATGLVGRHALTRLLEEPSYSEVRVLLRRIPQDFPPGAGKLAARIVDFEKLEKADPSLFAVNHIYCCLGTTIRLAGSQEAFRRVDHDYVLAAAQLGAKAGVQKFLLVSSVGAHAHSGNFYLRTKGETENAVGLSGIPEVHAFRPSFILGKRPGSRPLERIGITLFRPLSPLLVGPLRRYRPIQADDVARAMLIHALAPKREGFWVHEGAGLS